MDKGMSCLMKMCTENVYNDNAFHLLGLRTTATPRQIRRRREDIESAKTFGGDSWENEFKCLMGNRPIPTQEEVEEAFNRLEDPESRIISEFFWMWPIDDDDTALEALAKGRRGAALDIWEQIALGFGKKRTIAQHNLAVAYQFYAIDAELQALNVNDGYIPDEFRPKIQAYWNKSFSCWEELADNDEFWEIFETRMREFDDPRLTGGFIRRFRAEFPIAFDNINAQLAAQYAKKSCFDDAKRHVDYMSRTMSGLDDVQENMNIIFTPMEQRVQLLINGFDEKVKADPAQGLECARRLLEETKEILHVAAAILKNNERIRIDLFTQTVTACNHYIVQYGNKTGVWERCLKPLSVLLKLACTPENRKLLESNIKAAKENVEEAKLRNTCWICGKNKADRKYGLKMYGDVTHEWGRTSWRYGTFDVPVCTSCWNEKKKTDKRLDVVRTRLTIVVFAIVFVFGICKAPSLFIVWGFIAFIIGWISFGVASLIVDGIKGGGRFIARCKEYPPIKELRKEGWKFGEKPPTN